MDMSRWPGKIWDVSHKTLAVAAGLGHMGVNRLVMHPKHGNYIQLNSILINAEVDQYDKPLAHNHASSVASAWKSALWAPSAKMEPSTSWPAALQLPL